MCYFLAFISIILSSASYVTGFQSLAVPLIHRNLHSTVQRLKSNSARSIVCQQQTVGKNELNGEEPEVVIQIEDLSPSQIAELIEVSFIQACMVLDFVCRVPSSVHHARTQFDTISSESLPHYFCLLKI